MSLESVLNLFPSVPEEIVDFFTDHSTFTLVTHQRGDVDSASVFALAQALRKYGKCVQVHHDLPAHLAWMIPDDEQTTNDQTTQGVVVAMDTGNYARLAFPFPVRQRVSDVLSEYAREGDIPIARWQQICPIDLVIDHHVSNPGYGGLNWIDPEGSSTAELVIALAVALARRTGRTVLDRDMAWRLYAGIASDTQWFQRKSRLATYAVCGWLEAEFLIDKIAMTERMDAKSESYFLLGEVLRQSFRRDGNVVSAILDSDSLRRFNVTDEEAANLIEDLERLPASIVILFVETRTGEVRVRFRGKDRAIIDLAKQFGGGGHTFRAGAILSDLSQTEDVLSSARQWAKGGL